MKSLNSKPNTFKSKTALITLLVLSINGSAKACEIFDFSPLCQATNAIRATGFTGSYGPISSGVGGLNSFVQQLLASYQLSGRPYGFYPQNLNNSTYFNASNFNSSGVFFRFNNPF
jgi:hypothetical protein